MAADDKTDDKDIVERAQKRGRRAFEHWSKIYDKAKSDLKFISDEPGSQWYADDYDFRHRSRQPALQIDQLMQFVNQVSNNVRMNTPSINVIPADNAADKETAEIFKGRIKDIEHQSNADDAYDNAVNSAIKCGIGFIRIDHDYRDGQTFEQDIRIDRMVNPFSVLIDPDSVEPDGSDAMFGLIVDEISEATFKKDYPDFEPSSFDIDGISAEHCDGDNVKVCEYFEVVETPTLIGMLQDGSVEPVNEAGSYIRTREVMSRSVKRCKLSGSDVLEETTFPGIYIPIVPVYGEEAWEGGERKLNSLIRRAKDAQRMYNYWKSTEADLLMRAPKSVAIAPVGVTEKFANDWENPNKATVLRYEAKVGPNGQFLPPPTLTPPPPIPAGIVNASMAAQQDIRATMGLYNAFLGERSNETSGIAINARKVEGDRAVFHFGDNLVRSINQVGRILVSMIPVIDDTPKLVSVIDATGEQKVVGINGMITEGQERSFDMSKGQYSVKVTTGSSLATMRQEFALAMQTLIEKQPDLLTVFGDIWMENQDFPGAAAIAERLERMLRPELRDMEDGKDPQVAALTQENQQLKGVMSQMQAEMQSKQAELQMKQQEIAIKAQGEQADNQLEVKKLRLEEARLVAEIKIKEQEMVLKTRELEIKQLEAEASLMGMAGVVTQPANGLNGQMNGVV